MEGLRVEENSEGVRFTVKVVPGSSKTAISGILDGMLKVKVAAAPEKGKANKCLLEFLASRLGLKKNSATILSGQTSAIKQIRIYGVSIKALNQILCDK